MLKDNNVEPSKLESEGNVHGNPVESNLVRFCARKDTSVLTLGYQAKMSVILPIYSTVFKQWNDTNRIVHIEFECGMSSYNQ